MRRFLILSVIVSMLVPAVVHAARKKPAPVPVGKPVLVIFGVGIGDKAVTGNEVAASAVLDQIKATGRFQMISFKPDLPVIARAIADGRITREALTKTSDPTVSAQIVALMGASYALNVTTSVAPASDGNGNKVVTILDLTRIDGKHWTSSAESDIAQTIGPREGVKLVLAASTAASAAVSGLIIQAFGQEGFNIGVGVTPDRIPTRGYDTPRDIDSEYAQSLTRADEYLSKRDFPNAICELRTAIDLKPDQPQPRVKLAKTYLDQGMIAQGIDEARRAALVNKDDVSVHGMLAKLYISNGDMADAATECAEVVRLDPKNVEARLNLGDIFWNQSRMNDAEAAYEEASTLDPHSPDPHRRLRKLYLAQKKYAAALDESLSCKLLTPGVKPENAVFLVIRDEFNEILDGLDSADNQFKHGEMNRKDCYQESKDAGDRIDALDKFISRQNVADDYKKAFPHAVLAVSLVEQANGYNISYLETENQNYAEQAGLLRTEARTEFDLYSKELAGKV